jgi:tetratricopeptide (TPR) repeat protein
LEQAIVLYQRALAIDPTYTAARNGLAGGYSSQAFLGHGRRSADENFQLAREATEKALAIDPGYAPAHAHLGWIAMRYDDDLPAAARHLEHALTLAPADPYVVGFAAELALALGRLNTAIQLDGYAAVHDPVNPGGHGRLGDSYRRAGRLEESIDSSRAVLFLEPARMEAHYMIGVVLLQRGDAQAALKEIQAEPDEGWRLTGLALVYHALGKKAESDAALAELIEKHQKSWSSSIAWVMAYRGDSDRAFEWMEKAVANHDTGVMSFPTEPLLANIHDDPRWLPFLRKLGKAPEQLAAIKFEVKVPQ